MTHLPPPVTAVPGFRSRRAPARVPVSARAYRAHDKDEPAAQILTASGPARRQLRLGGTRYSAGPGYHQVSKRAVGNCDSGRSL